MFPDVKDRAAVVSFACFLLSMAAKEIYLDKGIEDARIPLRESVSYPSKTAALDKLLEDMLAGPQYPPAQTWTLCLPSCQLTMAENRSLDWNPENVAPVPFAHYAESPMHPVLQPKQETMFVATDGDIELLQRLIRPNIFLHSVGGKLERENGRPHDQWSICSLDHGPHVYIARAGISLPMQDLVGMKMCISHIGCFPLVQTTRDLTPAGGECVTSTTSVVL